MPEKKDSYQAGNQGELQGGSQEASSQEFVDARLGDLLTRLLQEFERRSANRDTNLPPEVETGIANVTATLESILAALALNDSKVVISSVQPKEGPTTGGQKVRITGSHFVLGATVRFGDKDAAVPVVSLTEIQATTPELPAGKVDVIVNTLAGSAKGAYTYVKVVP